MKQMISNPTVLVPIAIVAVAITALAMLVYIGQADEGEVDVVAAPANAPAPAPIDPEDKPLEPAEVDRVVAAALEIAGGGTVTELDRSDDLGETYEVEVVTDAGEIDIALDENLDRVPNLRYDD